MSRIPVLNYLVLTLAGSATVRAADWYVAPGGDDSAAGTLEKPFATVQRAQKSANPGDTVMIRGGTYRPKETDIANRRGQFASITYLNKSGAAGKPITYQAYQNEKPVFDCSDVKPSGMRVSAFSVTGSWLHLIGLEVTGVQVTIQGHTQSICFENNGSHNVYERLSMHDGQAIGLYSVRGSDNLFLNCDAWNNWDSTSEGGKGGTPMASAAIRRKARPAMSSVAAALGSTATTASIASMPAKRSPSRTAGHSIMDFRRT
ncbi:MAG: hypothetical protein QM755_04080 [Luteolibacter sp.]